MMGDPSKPEATRAHYAGVMSKAAEEEKLCRDEFEAVYQEVFPMSAHFCDTGDDDMPSYIQTSVSSVKETYWHMWREGWKRARVLA